MVPENNCMLACMTCLIYNKNIPASLFSLIVLAQQTINPSVWDESFGLHKSEPIVHTAAKGDSPYRVTWSLQV